MDASEASRVLDAVEKLESRHGISIIKLSEPISSTLSQPSDPTSENSSSSNTNNAELRTSDVSNSSLGAPTPASLEADLAHYRELFAKLRFSYVEQVTKEKFIRAIVGDPPVIVAPHENAALEASNAASKAALKALKNDVADVTADLAARGRDLSRRYEARRAGAATLRDMPGRLAGLEDEVDRLRAEQERETGGGGAGRPELRLPLAATLDLVEERRARRAALDRQLEQLAAQVPRKRKEADRLRAELQPLEARRLNSAAAAGEARKRKEAALGGAGDDLEERGRWWRASETVLKRMLEV